MKTDPPHILCINPWIHDFAAYDFWAKPLGLLSIAAILRESGVKVDYVDCLDRFHPEEKNPAKILWDGRGPFRKTPVPAPLGLGHQKTKFSRYGILPQWFRADLKKVSKPDLIFVTSLMTYWASGVRETIQVLREIYPETPVVLGGIYASLCREHAERHSGADLVVTDRAEKILPEIVARFTGFTLKKYTTLDEQPYPALDLCSKLTYAPILTSRGCPLHCDYCASSFLEPRYQRRSPEKVFNEILHWHHGFHVDNFAFYDDALLVQAERHAFVLFEKIIQSGIDVAFHTPNALHVREISKKAADLMFAAGFKTIRMGLETTEFSNRRNHDAKVAQGEFDKAVRHLKSAGFSTDQIGAYLLCGLPEQDLNQVARSVEMVRRMGVTPTLAFYTPIPHTKMWEQAVQTAKYDLTADPVYTNNTLFPCVASQKDVSYILNLKNRARIKN